MGLVAIWSIHCEHSRLTADTRFRLCTTAAESHNSFGSPLHGLGHRLFLHKWYDNSARMRLEGNADADCSRDGLLAATEEAESAQCEM